MSAFVVLLRGVNLGPHRRVPAADLRGVAQDAGLADVRTLLTSGNLVVTPGTSGATVADDVARLVHDGLTSRLDLDVPAVALSATRLAAVVRDNPFPAAAREDPSHLQAHVPFGPVDEAGVARLDLRHPGRERIAVAEGVVYVHYVDGIGTSRLTADVLDKAAGTMLTGRNWNTVTRLLEMTRDLEG
ncbi:DUF1697 domain-containing protein [Antribacter gilvus]|uniref:DUF1697 domain-containing protein n=1 Tax=Antribacter gilvus TaxID=2304675 RepID=UPI000F79A0FA|nr:DUF1697 domain-containing protein [Antribacter gilvus]